LKAKKRKNKTRQIRFYLGDSEVYHCLLPETPILESVIIEKSILFFSDPEPCLIHRSAVRSRMIEEAFSTVHMEGEEWTDGELISGLKKWVELDDFDKVVFSG
jgi:hypothetical protein